ncbi:MAG: sigma-70 family RNA polymerase sigma factor [Verrucomicrobia bacterium]|nr:sigma-70 family RNA polymerase sigma factor [Verrucomicrobiota bacterium]
MSALNPDVQDVQDMSRLAAGHDAALSELMDRHAEKLFHYLVRSLQNEEDAADVAQETFAKVYQSRTRFDKNQNFSTWIYAIASNLVRDRYRWRSRHPQVSLDAESDVTGDSFRNNVPSQDPTPSDGLQRAERGEAVRRAVDALPEELCQTFILAEYEERSHAEIGEILGCSAKAVETRIYRARKQLRTMLIPLLQEG